MLFRKAEGRTHSRARGMQLARREKGASADETRAHSPQGGGNDTQLGESAGRQLVGGYLVGYEPVRAVCDVAGTRAERCLVRFSSPH